MSIDEQERLLRQKLREMQSPFSAEEEEKGEKLTFDQVVEWEDGKPRLRKKRAGQLRRDIEFLRDAMQYALVAKKLGLYRCKRCPKGWIILKRGEVWRFGVTKKGEKGRYSEEFLDENNLIFDIQFKGRLDECLEQEKTKIYNYPLQPENIARLPEERMVYPPGNLRTD